MVRIGAARMVQNTQDGLDLRKHSLCWDLNPVHVDSLYYIEGLSRKNFEPNVEDFEIK